MATKADFSPSVRLGCDCKSSFPARPKLGSDAATLKEIGLFCGIGLIVALLLATNGLDLSIGFF